MSEPAIVVLGLGEIGRPIYEYLQRANPHTHGVDVEPVAVASPVAIMHVCYPFTPTNGFVETTVAYAHKYQPQIIAVHSTVVPGTTREIERRTGVAAVYSPVRGKHTRMADDLMHYDKFVAGGDAAAVERVAAQLRQAGFKTSIVGAPETLELAKLLETTYFGLLIAWAQDMDRFARACGANYSEISKFFAEIDYLPQHVFAPGYIGGHCVMPNIALLKSKFESAMLDAIVSSNELKGSELGAAAVANEKSKERARIEPKKIERGSRS